MKNLLFAAMITLFIGTTAFAAPKDAPFKSITALKKLINNPIKLLGPSLMVIKKQV